MYGPKLAGLLPSLYSREMRLAFCFLLLAFAGSAEAQVDSAPKVQARLIAEAGEIAPGSSVTVALEQNIRPGWHTYWRNPGEAGLPTEIKWSLPPGWKAGPIEWPYPRRLPVGPLMNYGYEGNVWLLTRVTAPPTAKPSDTATLKAMGSWLVCKEVCIPEDQNLSLQLSVSASPAAPYPTIKGRFDAARAKLPVPSPWPVRFHLDRTLDLFVAAPPLAHGRLQDVTFFPLAGDVLTDFAPQFFEYAPNGLVLHLKPAKKPRIGSMLSGVLVLKSADGSVRALAIAARHGPVPLTQNPATEAHGLSFIAAIFFALLGGIILNLMPCVLPVIAMKALALVTGPHGDRRAAARESFSYGAGAVLSFLLFGIAVAGLRAGGEAVGWGFQLQNPAVVAGFALLVFVVGLNLSGVFEVPGIGAGEALTRRGGAIGAFFTGILAVAVAAPCTAPFMAAAMGYALTQSLALSLWVFLALGLGFAAPFVLVGISPGLTRLLPRPGGWMQWLRQFLAYPMYATGLWLVWVFSLQTSTGDVLVLLALALVVAFALWVFGATQGREQGWRTLGWLALMAAVAAIPVALSGLAQTQAVAGSPHLADVSGLPSQPYSTSLLRSLRDRNRPVFVNATAAWCITCLVNEKLAFSSVEVRRAFGRKHVAYLVADWTNRNPEISALLQAHGRSGVPLYLYFSPGAPEAYVLPQILTPGEVLKAIGR